MRHVETRDGRTAYDVVGDGPIDLVLLHGHAWDGRTWAPVLARLAPGHRLIVPDLRGHGETQTTDAAWTFADWVADVRAVLRHAGARRPWIVGHSLGGHVAAGLAVDVGEELGGVVVLAHAGLTPAALVPSMSAFVGMFRDAGIPRGVVDHFMGLWFTPEHREREPAWIERESARILALPAADASWTCHAVASAPDLRPRLADVACPLSFLLGGQDPLIQASDLDGFVRPEQARVVPGWGHFFPVEDPDGVAAAVRRIVHAQA